MKITMEFNNDSPEDNALFDKMYHAEKVHAAVQDFRNWLRCQIKHGNLPGHDQEILEKVSEMFNDHLDEYGVDNCVY